MARLIPCPDSGAKVQSAWSLGSSYHVCPTCGKTVRVSGEGKLFTHGTRVKKEKA